MTVIPGIGTPKFPKPKVSGLAVWLQLFPLILCSGSQTHTDAEKQLAWPRETQELTAVNRTIATDSGGPAHLQANPETHQNMPSHTDEGFLGEAEQRFRSWGTPSPYHSSLQWALPAHRDSLRPYLKTCICKGHTAGRTVPASSLVWGLRNPMLCSSYLASVSPFLRSHPKGNSQHLPLLEKDALSLLPLAWLLFQGSLLWNRITWKNRASELGIWDNSGYRGIGLGYISIASWWFCYGSQAGHGHLKEITVLSRAQVLSHPLVLQDTAKYCVMQQLPTEIGQLLPMDSCIGYGSSWICLKPLHNCHAVMLLTANIKIQQGPVLVYHEVSLAGKFTLYIFILAKLMCLCYSRKMA